MNEKLTISITKRTPESEIRENEKLVHSEYEKSVNELIAALPENLANVDKLAALYGVMLDKVEYDFDRANAVNEDGTIPNTIPASEEKYFATIEGRKLRLAGKDVAVINGFGVCEEFSEAFTDIATRLGISCKTIEGKTGRAKLESGSEVARGHAWNQVLVDGEIKNIDITYGLFAGDEAVKQEKGIAPEMTAANFFFVDSEELRRIGPHHDFEDSADLQAIK